MEVWRKICVKNVISLGLAVHPALPHGPVPAQVQCHAIRWEQFLRRCQFGQL